MTQLFKKSPFLAASAMLFAFLGLLAFSANAQLLLPWSEYATDGVFVINRPPNTPDPSSPEGGVATGSVFPVSPLTPILTWSLFADSDGAGVHDVPGPGGHADADDQSGYHAQVAEDSGFSTIAFDRSVAADSNSTTVDSGLRYDVSYFWRVRVRDDHNLFSSFGGASTGTNCRGIAGENCAFFTPPSSPPSAGFTFTPVAPTIVDTIQFTDTSVDLDDAFSCPRHAPPGPVNGQCRIVSWLWSFGDSTSSTAQNPSHLYAARGRYTVTLTVTDDDGQTNAVSRVLTIRPKLPDFKEVLPR